MSLMRPRAWVTLVALVVITGACTPQVPAGPAPAPEVAITASDPPSPAPSEHPRLIGVAPDGTATIRIFPTIDCSGAAVGYGDAATFTGAGVPVTVGLGTTTAFTALATGPGVAACSAPFTYVNSLTAPTGYESEPNGTLATADPVTVAVGVPADIAGLLDGVGFGDGADLFSFTVAAGRSIRIETFDRTGAACDQIDTRLILYAPTGGTGGTDDDDGIELCSLIDPAVDLFADGVVAGEFRALVTGTPGAQYRIRIEVLP